MPRYARIHVPGGLCHVICRFHDHRFHLDHPGAREKYLELLGKAAGRFHVRIIAYCLMSSHVHLVVQLGVDGLGRFTKAINNPFAQWLNEQRGGLGAVFADRPKSLLVHAETHGLLLVRYVHNNPVRAGLVTCAMDSDWSSHRAYLGLDEAPAWLAVDAVLGSDDEERAHLRRELGSFVDAGREQERSPELSGEISRDFRRRVSAMMGGPLEISVPVLGPDDFVRDVFGMHVSRQRERLTIDTGLKAEELATRVFMALELSPDLAAQQTRFRPAARARALTAWLWVERLGRAQVALSQAFRLRQSAVVAMLAKVRRGGITSDELAKLEAVLLSVSAKSDSGRHTDASDGESIEIRVPQFLLLQRRR